MSYTEDEVLFPPSRKRTDRHRRRQDGDSYSFRKNKKRRHQSDTSENPDNSEKSDNSDSEVIDDSIRGGLPYSVDNDICEISPLETVDEFFAALEAKNRNDQRVSTPIPFDESVAEESYGVACNSVSASSSEESDSSGVSLYQGSDVSVRQFRSNFTSLVSTHKLSDAAAKAVLDLFSNTLPMPNATPSLYELNKESIDAANSLKQYAVGDGIFTVVDVADQVRKMVANFPLIFDVEIGMIPGLYTDITDGSVFRTYFSEQGKTIYLILNADGVATRHKSKGYQLWPISASIINIPPTKRMQSDNIVLLGVYHGRQKPDPQRLLDILCESEMFNILIGTHPVKLQFVAFVADFPAKASFLNMSSFNSKYGCTLCFVKGMYSREYRKMVFPFENVPCALRSSSSYSENAFKAEEEAAPIFGVKGRSLLARFIGVPVGAPLDIMHLVYLNVTKRLISYAIRHKLMDVDRISSLMTQIQVPHHFRRKPRSLNDLAHWKATEFKHALLYFMPPLLLLTNASKEILFLFTTLSTAIHLLSSDCVSEDDIIGAETLLRAFQSNLCQWFGNESSTISVHALTHLPAQVRLFGPLWTVSAAVFENFFHSLVRGLHGTRNEAQLLVRNFLRRKTCIKNVPDENVHSSISASKVIINGKRFSVLSKSQRASSSNAVTIIDGMQRFVQIMQILPEEKCVRCRVFEHRSNFCRAAQFRSMHVDENVIATLERMCKIAILMPGCETTVELSKLKSHFIPIFSRNTCYRVPVLCDFEHD